MAFFNGQKVMNANVTETINVDQHFYPESKNAQSGKAVAEAIKNIKPDDFANALKVTTVGKIVSVNDASPVEHNLKVKLTSDTITDFSSVEVYQQGKNIMPRVAWGELSNGGATYVRNEDNTITLNGVPQNTVTLTLNTTANTDFSFLKPNTDYRLTLEGVNSANLCLQTKRADGTYNYYSQGSANFPETETVDRLFFQVKSSLYPTLENVVVRFQIEEGTVATEYVPPIVKTITANADGIVEGFKSLPTMLFKTSNSNVKINLEYNRDINKPKQFEKVYDGIIQDVTFDKPYTELFIKYQTMMEYGADFNVNFDNGSDIFAWLDGAEKTDYYVKLDGIGAIFDVYYNYYPISEFTILPNANYITGIQIYVDGDVDNTTDTLTIYAR